MRRRFSRDADDPQSGEVYESKFGNRWKVVGRSDKGRVIVKRAGNRYDGELQWSPDMLKKLKLLRAAEEKAVRIATAPIDLKPVDKSFFGWLTGKPANRDPDRKRGTRYYVFVIESLKNRRRSFLVGFTSKKPSQSRRKGAGLLRRDLTKRLNPIRNRKDAVRTVTAISRALRRRGLVVKGGY